jgi:hypothetical protein
MSNPGAELAALRQRETYYCAYCGKPFESIRRPPGPRYCTSSHRASAANQRKSQWKKRLEERLEERKKSLDAATAL